MFASGCFSHIPFMCCVLLLWTYMFMIETQMILQCCIQDRNYQISQSTSILYVKENINKIDFTNIVCNGDSLETMWNCLETISSRRSRQNDSSMKQMTNERAQKGAHRDQNIFGASKMRIMIFIKQWRSWRFGVLTGHWRRRSISLSFC